MNPILILAALVTAIIIVVLAVMPAHAASYEQGVCDGIRAAEVYAPSVNIAIIADGRTQRYFRCNGSSPTDPSGPTVFVRPSGGLGRR